MNIARRWMVTWLLAVAPLVHAQAPSALQVRSWAAGCANCHGTHGQAQAPMPVLAGLPKEVIEQRMQDFKSGKVPSATVMPMRSGAVAVQAGLATANQRWCEVDFLTFESKVLKNVHVLGDAVLSAPFMPKSGHMANQHGNTCAAAVVALLTGQEVNPQPVYNNTCYSFVSATGVVHVASVHRYDAAQKTMLVVPGSGGVSAQASTLEGVYAMGWARNIWADTLA